MAPPPISQAKRPADLPPPRTVWRWLLLVGVVCFGVALVLFFAAPSGTRVLVPAAGFALGGLLLVWVGVGRRYRATQGLVWQMRQRGWH